MVFIEKSIVPTLRYLSELLPTVCIVCGRSVSAKFAICDACVLNLPWITHACYQCGESGALPERSGSFCNKCLLSPPPFRFCSGLFHYRTPVDALLSGFKFHARFDAGHAFATLLAGRMDEYYGTQAKPELILPVPLHTNRLRTRGYNQALEIAKVVSSLCNIPVSTKLVTRSKDTAPQTEVDTAVARRRNMQQAFNVNDSVVRGNVKSVAIIDDVVTTMATVSSLSNALRQRHVEVIDIWCVARAHR